MSKWASAIIIASNLTGDVSYTFSDTVTESDIANAYNNPQCKAFKVYDDYQNVCYVPKMWVKVTVMEPKNEVEVYAYAQKWDKKKIMLWLIKQRRKEHNKPFMSVEILEKAYERTTKIPVLS